MKRKPTKGNKKIWLDDGALANLRMQSIQVAAGLPEPEPASHGMMAQSWTRPGKDAGKVIADAEKIIAFITKPA